MSVANVSLGQTRRIFCCPRSYTSRRFFGHSTSSKTSQSGYPEPAEEETITHTPQRFSSRPHPTVERIIRVSHAGEFGADRIYAGQAAVLRNSSVGPVIQVIGGASPRCTGCQILIVLHVCGISGSAYIGY